MSVPALAHEASKRASANDEVLYEIMSLDPENFGEFLNDPDEYEIQILFTEIIRDEYGRPTFIRHEYGLEENYYFAPSSAVKMTVAALFLQKLYQLDIEGLDLNCTLSFDTKNWWDTAESGCTIGNYIRRIIHNSDNNCYNRLYEFLGTEYINETLRNMGYTDSQLCRRYSMQTTALQDSITGPAKILKNGRVIYSQPGQTSGISYTLEDRDDIRGLLRGDAYITSRGKVSGPKSFYQWNYLSIDVLQGVLKAIMFPEEVEERQRFDMPEEFREHLITWLLGTETSSRKYLYYGKKEGNVDSHIRIYNKTGTSYGNIMDNAYVKDTKYNIEYMLTAVIYVNPNGVIGDDTYDYINVGLPFLRDLGKAVHAYMTDNHGAVPEQQ